MEMEKQAQDQDYRLEKKKDVVYLEVLDLDHGLCPFRHLELPSACDVFRFCCFMITHC